MVPEWFDHRFNRVSGNAGHLRGSNVCARYSPKDIFGTRRRAAEFATSRLRLASARCHAVPNYFEDASRPTRELVYRKYPWFAPNFWRYPPDVASKFREKLWHTIRLEIRSLLGECEDTRCRINCLPLRSRDGGRFSQTRLGGVQILFTRV